MRSVHRNDLSSVLSKKGVQKEAYKLIVLALMWGKCLCRLKWTHHPGMMGTHRSGSMVEDCSVVGLCSVRDCKILLSQNAKRVCCTASCLYCTRIKDGSEVERGGRVK